MSPWQKLVSEPEARLVVPLVELQCWYKLNLIRRNDEEDDEEVDKIHI